MATPSSSATTPSPPISLHAAPPRPAPAPHPPTDTGSPDDRQAAVTNLMKRVEVSKLTRALRARLSYASYKVAHNASNLSMPVLEAQAQAGPLAGSKRKPSSRDYYNNPATQAGTSGGTSANATAPADARIAGPSSASSAQRSMYYPNVPSGLGPSASLPSASTSANATSTLFSSILAPPPNKRARTVLNPSAPTSPPSRAAAAAQSRSPGKAGGAGPPRTGAKGKKADKDKARLKGQGSRAHLTPGESEEIDRKAAEALTSLLRGRPGGAMSPRSSVSAGSDIGSTSSATFAQGTSRASFSGAGAAASHPHAQLHQQSHLAPPPRALTPTQHAILQQAQAQAQAQAQSQSHTPRAGPNPKGPMSDNEAAENMLFLATSPSPVRASVAARDAAAFRNLSGGGGRVLFPAAAQTMAREGGSFSSIGSQMGDGEAGMGGESLQGMTSGLGKGVQRPASRATERSPPNSQGATVPSSPNLGPRPGSASGSSLSRHGLASAPNPPFAQGTWSSTLPSSASTMQHPDPHTTAPPTSGGSTTSNASSTSVPFNIGDFIHISPAPTPPASTPSASASAPPPPPPSSAGAGVSKDLPNLRKDVGRKLFEEEQRGRMEDLHIGPGPGAPLGVGGAQNSHSHAPSPQHQHQHQLQHSHAHSHSPPQHGHGIAGGGHPHPHPHPHGGRASPSGHSTGSGLGAGIDLVKT